MDIMDRIMKAASDLGHLLKQHEIIKRYEDLSKKIEGSEKSRELLEEYLATAAMIHEKETANVPIEVSEKHALADLEKKAREDAIIPEFLATQGYYMQVIGAVNQQIAHPTGEPPRESSIIVPGEAASRIVLP